MGGQKKEMVGVIGGGKMIKFYSHRKTAKEANKHRKNGEKKWRNAEKNLTKNAKNVR
jgi:hypothetical protein